MHRSRLLEDVSNFILIIRWHLVIKSMNVWINTSGSYCHEGGPYGAQIFGTNRKHRNLDSNTGTYLVAILFPGVKETRRWADDMHQITLSELYQFMQYQQRTLANEMPSCGG